MRLILCGGGTGGHIIPNVAIIEELKAKNPQINLLYLSAKNDLGKKIMADLNVPYKSIICGKLRRYFSFQNFIDFFKVPIGIVQSFFIILKFKPQKIFCKGGYVSFPVVIAARLLKIPIFLHESDVIPGLANLLCAKFATKIFISFEQTKKYFPPKKVIFTGSPVRRELANGSKQKGLEFTGLNDRKPIILSMGGSQGSNFINNIIYENLDELLKHYQIVHIHGEKNPSEKKLPGYKAFTYVQNELKDLYALADLIISRAGAVSLSEMDFFNKKTILIPLPTSSSRGDQIDNAKIFAKDHDCEIIFQHEYKPEKFLKTIREFIESPKKHMSSKNKFAGLETIVTLLEGRA